MFGERSQKLIGGMFVVGLVMLVAGIFLFLAAGRTYNVHERHASDTIFTPSSESQRSVA